MGFCPFVLYCQRAFCSTGCPRALTCINCEPAYDRVVARSRGGGAAADCCPYRADRASSLAEDEHRGRVALPRRTAANLADRVDAALWTLAQVRA